MFVPCVVAQLSSWSASPLVTSTRPPKGDGGADVTGVMDFEHGGGGFWPFNPRLVEPAQLLQVWQAGVPLALPPAGGDLLRANGRASAEVNNADKRGGSCACRLALLGLRVPPHDDP